MVVGSSFASSKGNPTVVTIPTFSQLPYKVPNGLSRVVELAYNLWWSWSPAGHSLWTAIDPSGWEQYHNPIDLISSIDRAHWEELAQVESVEERYRRAIADFDRYMTAEDTWFDLRNRDLDGPVAYLCTEFGVHHSLPFYSGGLGILAGDHAKAASDLGIPFVGVGLLFRRGYFRQEIEASGAQQHIYPTLDLRGLPVLPVAAPTGGQLTVGIEFPGREVRAAVWCLQIGRVPLLLLDTDIRTNDPADRHITHTLYVRGREMRFCQELVLGIGAVRALEALGIEPGVWHVNEGHAAMSVLERLAGHTKAGDIFDVARSRIKERTIFTLHTPVPAGNEVFDGATAAKYLEPWAERTGLGLDGVMALGKAHDADQDRFDLGALAIRFAAVVNGVSQRHGEIVGRDWHHLIGGDAHAVTNGVHTPTWIGRDAGRILTGAFGPSWAVDLLDDEVLLVEHAPELRDEQIWQTHQARKEIFVRFARGRLRDQFARHGAGPDELRAVENLLPTDRLTLGFARRFATYKRATLMFEDLDRLRRILTNPDRPVQVVFAGKAHPADVHGQEYIRRIEEIEASPEFKGHVYQLENYDARMARFMVQGVDVWVNNPRPPMEASGTSGMKAAINGTLNLSVLDGWWIEGFNGKNGWTFGRDHGGGDWAEHDRFDASSFYDVLEHEVAPLYYDRDADGIPHGWVDHMRESIVSSLIAFSSHRMVKEYFELAYGPLGVG
jgi:glycogen phosphorylase